MTSQIETPDKLSRTELLVAVMALLFLLIARPILAQTNAIPSNTTGLVPPGGSINPTTQNSTVSPSSTTIPSYLLPNGQLQPTDSQAHREATQRQNGGTLLNPNMMPECRIDDSNCIEQRNRLNQANPANPQQNPVINR